MLLILSDSFDAHADRVVEKLNTLKLPYFRLNLDTKSLYNTFISFQNHSWYIKNKNASIKSDDISCVWLRRSFVELTLEEKENKEKDIDFKIWCNEFNATLLGLFYSFTFWE